MPTKDSIFPDCWPLVFFHVKSPFTSLASFQAEESFFDTNYKLFYNVMKYEIKLSPCVIRNILEHDNK